MSGPGRIIGVDVARSLALTGMVAAHLLGSEPVDGQVGTWYQIVSGRSASLFALLAGLSLALITRAATDSAGARGERSRLFVRAVVIGMLGIVLGIFPSGLAVILTYYGVLFLFALPVVRWRAGQLALLALAWGLLTPVLSMLVRPHLPETTQQVPNPLSLADPWQLVTELTFTGYYPVVPWATYLFAGMAIGRLDLGSARWGRRLLVWGGWLAILALAVSRLVTRAAGTRESLIVSYDGREEVTDWASLDLALRQGLHGTTPTDSWWWLGVWSPHSGSIVDLAHTTGSSMAVLGLCLVLVQVTGRRARRVWQIAFGAGSMTLSLYTLHIMVVSAPESVPLTHSLSANLAGILALGAAFAALRTRGPLESLISQLTSDGNQTAGARRDKAPSTSRRH
jgi:uncharacterized membrane protein